METPLSSSSFGGKKSSFLQEEVSPLVTNSEAASPGRGNKTSLAIKITLIVLAVLFASAAIILAFSNVGTMGSIVLGGCGAAALVAAAITHLLQNRPSSISTHTLTAASSESTETKVEALPSELLSILIEKNVIKELGSTIPPGIVLKKKEESEWDQLKQLNTIQDTDPTLFSTRFRDPREDRYANIRPFTENSFLFSTDEALYINASKMLLGEYILTQGPKKETVEDFWKMVWDSGANIVIMATNLTEGGKEKCWQYWPEGADFLSFHSMDIASNPTENLNNPTSSTASITIRPLILTKGGEVRRVLQYHFNNWPDHEIHPSLGLILRGIKDINEHYDSKTPLIIHCSAGVGRSGVFLVCHLLYQLDKFYRKKGKGAEIDLYRLIRVLRTPPYGRHMTIMTEEQFQMLYAFGAYLQSKERIE